ncbi:hypothetical protein F2P81_025187 [Scophthalmus maximus]|uniref:Uncharacterized protein n=1 Tax=Scophthalmus maximus TaxID=52904 RepID=A0A6A4RTM1_SCOMX|nr:hypothetical protein F2P81_025187 [Scophthalmus maximus]
MFEILPTPAGLHGAVVGAERELLQDREAGERPRTFKIAPKSSPLAACMQWGRQSVSDRQRQQHQQQQQHHDEPTHRYSDSVPVQATDRSSRSIAHQADRCSGNEKLDALRAFNGMIDGECKRREPHPRLNVDVLSEWVGRKKRRKKRRKKKRKKKRKKRR